MVQCIDHQCDVLAHVAVDVVRTAEQFRCLIGQVGGYDLVDCAVCNRLVKTLQAVGEQTEGCNNEDTVGLSLL